MKALFLILILTIDHAYAQTGILKEIDFDDGKWELYGLSLHNQPSTLQDSLGNFYTDDRDVLKKIQQKWVLDEHNGFYACGYHYEFRLMHADTQAFSWFLNLSCNEICGDLRCYEFPEALLRHFYSDLDKQIPKTDYAMADLESARKLYQKLDRMDKVLILEGRDGNWKTYPGQMKITVVDYDIDSYVKIDPHVDSIIKRDFPNEDFKIAKGSSTHLPGGPDTYDYYVYCPRSMAESFNTYPIKTKWEAYQRIEMTVVGLTEPEIDELKILSE